MLIGAASASTHDEAAHAASLALTAEPGETPGTAIDAVLAGVLAVAARKPSVLLGAGTLLLAGTGEGLFAVDGRARTTGIGAPRPRGFVDASEVPLIARIATPGLPSALARAHTGRGRLTLTAIVRHALAAAGDVEPDRARSLRAFAREAGAFVHEAMRAPLLAATARALGGHLTLEDLEGVRADLVPARTVRVDTRAWSFAPWADALAAAFQQTGDGTLVDAAAALDEGPALGIVCANDAHGAFAAAAFVVAAESLPIEGTGLALPALAPPVMRGVTRQAPGAILALGAPLGVAALDGTVDLAVGVGGVGGEHLLAQVVRGLSRSGLTSFEEVIAQPRARRTMTPEGHALAQLEERLDRTFGVVSGVHVDERGRGRPLVDPRR
ncbi:MAG: hypothetical protein JNL79_26640 [Myxococcales bacterium]|nr:hypothetical protein [Myxococcales bacterium]